MTGYKYAMLSGYNVVAVMAGDAQMHPDDLIAVLSPVLRSEADYVKGNRFLCKEYITVMPYLRVLGNYCFSLMSCLASGYYHIFDTQCGYSAINIETLRRLDLNNLYNRYGFPTDMLAKLSMISAKVLDVPVKSIYNKEMSGIKPVSYTFTIIFLTLKLFFERQIKKFKNRNIFLRDY